MTGRRPPSAVMVGMVAVIALLTGAGLTLLAVAAQLEQGSREWNAAMDAGGDFLVAAVVVGCGWSLWLSIVRRSRR